LQLTKIRQAKPNHNFYIPLRKLGSLKNKTILFHIFAIVKQVYSNWGKMNDLILEQTKNLMQENTNIRDDSLCKRFLPKKYKCVMLCMLSIIVVSQLFIIIFEKLDEVTLKNLVEKISNSSRH